MNKERKSMQDISKFIERNFFNIVTLILLSVILLKNCKPTVVNPGIKIIRDTTWIIKDSTVYSRPQLIKTIPVDVSRDTIINHYIPDTNYQKLVLQYQQVVNQLLAKNIHRDSLKIDSIGWVKVEDTITKNLLVSRSYKYDLKYPIIKETTILPAPVKRQFFVGGMLQGIPQAPVNAINAGLLYKTKKDQILGINAGFDRNGNILYGIQSYWKITLKK